MNNQPATPDQSPSEPNIPRQRTSEPRVTPQRNAPWGQTDTYLTPEELVAYLKLPSKQTVYQWRTRGYGPPGTKIGKHVRFRREDVDKWMEEQKGAA